MFDLYKFNQTLYTVVVVVYLWQFIFIVEGEFLFGKSIEIKKKSRWENWFNMIFYEVDP